jgi:hypothetical protein
LAPIAKADPPQETPATVASQGPVDGAKVFRSPMILTTPFPVTQPDQLGKWVVLDDMAQFQCDGVTLRRLKARAKPWRNSFLVSIDAFTYTLPGEDKLVHLKFEVMSGAMVVAEGAIGRLKAEENDRGRGSTSFSMPRSAVPKEGTIVLRTTVTVANK